MFGAGFAALAIERVHPKNPAVTRVLEYVLCFSFFLYLFPSYNSLFILPNPKDGPLYSFSTPEYTAVSIDNLIRLNIPTKTDQCWDIPIPCTPYYRPSLHLRKNSLDSGFMLDDTVTFADIHNGSIPKGMKVSPGIGVALMSYTWFGFEEEKNIRWMRSPGTILVFTEHATNVKFSLKTFVMNIHGESRNEWQLRVFLNNLSHTELSLKSGMITEVVLGLRSDFNIIALELASASTRPNETHDANAETRSMSVAFSSIELTATDDYLTRFE
jgi:hypothetical protein